MTSDILRTAYKEREALQTELDKVPAWQKMQQIQRLIATYETFERAEQSVATNLLPTAKVIVQSSPRPGSKVSQVNETIANHLRQTGRRASSGQLLPVVEKAGVVMSGSVPSKTLASFLTNSDRFNNVKGLGYGLAEWGNAPGPNDAERSTTETSAEIIEPEIDLNQPEADSHSDKLNETDEFGLDIK